LPSEPTRALLTSLSDADLYRLRADLFDELKSRSLPRTVGQRAEQLVIDYYKATPGRPTLVAASTGTANVDALSNRGDRYSIKSMCTAKKSGQIYPDPSDRSRQLFEYLVLVKVDWAWSLEVIYEFDWTTFCQVRSWDSRMNAWYVAASSRTFARATVYRP